MTVEVCWKWSFFFVHLRQIRQSFTKKAGHLKCKKPIFSSLTPQVGAWITYYYYEFTDIFPLARQSLVARVWNHVGPGFLWFPLVFSGSQGWENTVGGYIGLYGSVNTFKNKAVGQGYTQFRGGGGGKGGRCQGVSIHLSLRAVTRFSQQDKEGEDQLI